MIEEVIPELITNRINNMLTMLPSNDEISNAVFSLNKHSAPGPDGFGALFFQNCWEIIKHDVCKAVLQFFIFGWLLPNFNSNIIALIPNTNNAFHGFFSCSRGVRQGDPLSPVLFCLAEEVLSRSMTKLVREGRLKLIHGSRNNLAPSHILYADDITIILQRLIIKHSVSNRFIH